MGINGGYFPAICRVCLKTKKRLSRKQSKAENDFIDLITRGKLIPSFSDINAIDGN